MPRAADNVIGRMERQAIGLFDVNYLGRPAGMDRTSRPLPLQGAGDSNRP